MKLTEKELNEFPIGTKIYTEHGEKYMKLDNSTSEWREMKGHYWMSSRGLLNSSIKQVEIPNYIEYIQPKPILDDKEKGYLSGVIRPFRRYIYGILKRECESMSIGRAILDESGWHEVESNGCEYITLFNSRGYNIDLPFFEKGTMYKGMELDREYSLEELEL
ncbi:MAG: hypothetical protein J6T10_14725 [Methanobrevibacter sp.]|nr:hypothetical protein [Methanobrevibacter sp.]